MRLLSVWLLSAAVVGCKKNVAPAPPPVGWHQEEGWSMACYHPPDFGQLNETDRRLKRSEVLDEMEKQWGGSRNDGISFPEDKIEEVEIVLLGRPKKIEAVAQDNLSRCKAVASGTSDAGAWESWLRGLPAKLTVGECLKPLDFTMFDYLDIGIGWQRALPICRGDQVRISGTVKDRYRISEKGPWINVEGDLSQPATGTNLPCNLEGCFAGQLILRFVSDSGVESLHPIGTELIFVAPEHGEISYRINDETFYDNIWFQKGAMTDHTAIEVTPVVAVEE